MIFALGPMKYEYFLNKSICPCDKTLIGTTTPGQSGPGSNANEGVHNIPQISWTDAV